MGSIFGSTSYQETEADKALREDIERKRKEEADEVAKQEADRVKQKKRYGKGLTGQRSLFSKSGQKGFFQNGKEI
jgi:hypothetical protein